MAATDPGVAWKAVARGTAAARETGNDVSARPKNRSGATKLEPLTKTQAASSSCLVSWAACCRCRQRSSPQLARAEAWIGQKKGIMCGIHGPLVHIRTAAMIPQMVRIARSRLQRGWLRSQHRQHVVRRSQKRHKPTNGTAHSRVIGGRQPVREPDSAHDPTAKRISGHSATRWRSSHTIPATAKNSGRLCPRNPRLPTRRAGPYTRK